MRTVYGVQELTVDRAIVVATHSWNTSEFYVALTRARKEYQIVDVGVGIRKSGSFAAELRRSVERPVAARRLTGAPKRSKSKSLALDHLDAM